jgi:hypothetical protein
MVVLRVSGVNFDVDAFLQEGDVTPAVVARRGERRFPGSQTNESVYDSSGMMVDVSDAEFGNLEQQTLETLQFLADNFAVLQRMANYPGVDGLEMDFAVDGTDAFVESYRFSPELLEQVGRLGITLCVSRYIPANGAA